MARKVHTIHTLPGDSPWQGGLPPVGSGEHPLAIRVLDRVLGVQRPAVLAHLRSIRLRHPDATPDEIIRILERRYLAAVTVTGGAVGATAVIPAITTGVTLALSGAETVGFLESTALYAQSVAEVHGIQVADPDRARALVLTLMLGAEGSQLIRQLAGQAGGTGPARGTFWGELVTKTLPRAAMGPLVDRLKGAFIRQFAGRGSASILGKAMPFGVGAVIGAGGNHILGRRVVTSAHGAFGPAPMTLPADLEPRPGAARTEHRIANAVGRAGRSVRTGVASAGSRTKRLVSRSQPDAAALPAADDATAAFVRGGHGKSARHEG